MTVSIHHGDCLQVLKGIEAGSVHAVVTDPPYGLTFMGKRWDASVPSVEVWAECLRVLKPGGHVAAFGGTRTYHRMACAIEDAGFEIRDQLGWMYGSGFPKSKNLKGEWDGWGSALKPAWEPIALARKPFSGTLQANAEAHGCGAINVQACRVGDTVESWPATRSYAPGQIQPGGKGETQATGAVPPGRWPANLIHDGSEEVLTVFPDSEGQSGDVRGSEPSRPGYGGWSGERPPAVAREDGGSAARFFYCAKADREDRNSGLYNLPERPLNWSSGEQSPGTFQSPNTNRKAQNHHPTVKPTDLMHWLCKLVTPPGGVVLDPFMGSGSTGRGALLGDFRFIGIEIDEQYIEIARRRIREIAPLFVAA